jgi:hypothetical protein
MVVDVRIVGVVCPIAEVGCKPCIISRHTALVFHVLCGCLCQMGYTPSGKDRSDGVAKLIVTEGTEAQDLTQAGLLSSRAISRQQHLCM